MIADAHVYTSGDFILQVFFYVFNIMNCNFSNCPVFVENILT